MMVRLIAVAAAATTCLAYAASDGPEPAAGQTVVVEVGGAKLTMADLEQKSGPALFQARTNYYEAERQAIQKMVDDYLLEQQARKEGVSVTELLERHVNAPASKEPSEDALRTYYDGVDTTEPYEAVRGKIIEVLKQRRTAKAREAYMQSLRSAANIVLTLPPPRAPISMKDVPLRGPANAPVTLLEYADFECPYCQQIHPVLQRIETEFKDKLAFAYKDYPLPMHPDAEKAAEAAHCAAAQGKYWEYHDTLFDKKQLSVASLKETARALHLDGTAFDACLDGGKMAGVVKDQMSEAQAFGMQGTPSILVNGRFVTGNLTYERLHGVIMEELSAATAAQADAGGKSHTHGER
ncbi:MAG TPA: thioredoxin domain-containing protein [Bryobacteraceae bacterium]|jgi:protein-disulfide isomerase|nr:thioredoxin domain-containing protein [Bryobacteraceae bacterium]